MDAMTRFNASCVEARNGCKELRTHLNARTGRAYFQVGGRRYIAARWLWEIKVGPLSQGECVLHKCDNPACVNLSHLFTGTQLQNIQDRDDKGRNRLSATHCKNGHEFTTSNTRQYGPGLRWRMCRACARENMKRYRTRKESGGAFP